MSDVAETFQKRGWLEAKGLWHGRHMAMAEMVAGWSKDPSTKVGAVLSDRQYRLLSVGYNGFPRGVSDDERLNDRATKYQMTVHAEANAILQAGSIPSGGIITVTHPPCASCMGLILNCGILQVVCKLPDEQFLLRWADSLKLTEDMAREAGAFLCYYQPITGDE